MSLDLQKVSIRTEVTTNLPLACELQTGLPLACELQAELQEGIQRDHAEGQDWMGLRVSDFQTLCQWIAIPDFFLPFLVSSKEEPVFFLKASSSCLQARGVLRND